ncbi:MAG TPA: FAD-dependent thymidylate synthase [Candidatus Bathyarchaeia archaeon]|nr:FAD-dependent thymidylate synthase [Candidatus Bathyarchaeia archaeon]
MDGEARILADSISTRGKRLTTLEVTFPRYVLAEFNTHRTFSRNSASSRAIPVKKQLEKIEEDPFIGEHWGANQPGMQAGAELTGEAREQAIAIWREAGRHAVEAARQLSELGVHKQRTNRLLEPFMRQTVIVTATEWDNFYALRAHAEAQPEIRDAAIAMRDAMDASEPTELAWGEWHTPLIQPDENFPLEQRIKISAGRCARVSYLTHDGVRNSAKDLELYDRLASSGHMSPMEHVARPLEYGEPQRGNFIGWHQHRADIPYEDNYGARPAS